MKNKFSIVRFSSCIAVIVIVALALFACNKKDSNNSPANGNSVSIANFAFSVSTLTVKTGTTVTWTNKDNTAHTVTADDNSFDSGNIAPGASFSKTFSAAGTVAYHCTIHSSMHGTVIVSN